MTMRALLVATITAFAAIAHAAPNPVERAIILINQAQVDEAHAALEPVLRDGPKTPLGYFAVGELAFYESRYVAAAEALRLAVGLPNGLDEEAALLAQLAEKTAERTREYKEEKSAHFIIRYPASDAILAPYALDTLERAYVALGDDFGERPKVPIVVEVYTETADLARVSPLTVKEIETSGTIALCKWNRILIVSPRALVFGYPWLDTLNHEYTHYIVSRVSHDTVPIWLHEGIAKFEEQRWQHPPGTRLTPSTEQTLASGIERKHLIPFSAMHPSMAKLPSQEDAALAFAEVVTFVEFLHQKRGYAGLRAVIDKLRATDRFTDGSAAVKAVFGKDLDGMWQDWRKWLEAKQLKKKSGINLAAQKLHFKHGNKPDGDEDDSSEIASDDKARQFTRLGALLKTHGRVKAATVEYEKAMALLPAGTMPLAGKLAHAYLELNDFDRAIAVGKPAVELYPDMGGPITVVADALLRKNALDEAGVYLEKAIALNPFDPSIHCGLERVYRGRKPVDTARADREGAACKSLSAR